MLIYFVKDAIDHFEKLEANTRIFYSNSLRNEGDLDGDDEIIIEQPDSIPLYNQPNRNRSLLKHIVSSFFSNIFAVRSNLLKSLIFPIQKIQNIFYHHQIFKQTRYLFKPKLIVNTSLILFIMFALCFGYYGLWIWLPELYKRMDLYGGSPCRPAGFVPSNQSQLLDHLVNGKNQSRCHIENKVFVSSFYSALSNLPGNLFTIFFIDKMGRNSVTCKIIQFKISISIKLYIYTFRSVKFYSLRFIGVWNSVYQKRGTRCTTCDNFRRH